MPLCYKKLHFVICFINGLSISGKPKPGELIKNGHCGYDVRKEDYVSIFLHMFIICRFRVNATGHNIGFRNHLDKYRKSLCFSSFIVHKICADRRQTIGNIWPWMSKVRRRMGWKEFSSSCWGCCCPSGLTGLEFLSKTSLVNCIISNIMFTWRQF